MKLFFFAKALSLSVLLSTSMAVSSATIVSSDFDALLTTTEGSSDFGSNSQRASSFSFSGGNQTLGSLSWLGVSPVIPSADDFTIRIYADNGGLPETTASILDLNIGNNVTKTDTGVNNVLARDIVSYETNLSTGVNLTSGVTYWLSIINDIGTNAGNDWRWTVSSLSSGSALARQLDSDPWQTFTATFQFELSTTPAAVPVPAALWLFLSGIAGIAAFKRKKQAA